jgi:hypothetical protein
MVSLAGAVTSGYVALKYNPIKIINLFYILCTLTLGIFIFDDP